MHWQEGYDGQADQPALIDERDLETYLPPELLGADDELRPVDWNTLPADEAEGEWRDLNEWVDWIRKSHGLPATVIAPSGAASTHANRTWSWWASMPLTRRNR